MNEEKMLIEDEETEETVITTIEQVMEKNRREKEEREAAEFIAAERTVADQNRDNADDADAMVKVVNARKQAQARKQEAERQEEATRQAAARTAYMQDEGLFVKMIASKPVAIKIEDPAEKVEKKMISMDYIHGFLTSLAICLAFMIGYIGVICR